MTDLSDLKKQIRALSAAERKKVCKRAKSTGPKKAPTAYQKFVSKYFKDHKGQDTAPKLMKAAGAAWKKISK